MKLSLQSPPKHCKSFITDTEKKKKRLIPPMLYVASLFKEYSFLPSAQLSFHKKNVLF